MLFVKALSDKPLSVSKAASTGKTFEFGQWFSNVIDENYSVFATATKHGNLFYLNCIGSRQNMAQKHRVMKCSNKEEIIGNIWHKRSGHLGAKKFESIVKEQIVDGFNYDPEKTFL